MDWVRNYLLTGLRINNLYKKMYDEFYIDAYHGPSDLISIVEAETEITPLSLKTDIFKLSDSLSNQGFTHRRVQFFEKQLRAMETVLTWLNNESMLFEDEVNACLDLQLEFIPDSYFQAGLELFDKSLPPVGNLRERFATWRKRNTQVVDVERLRDIIVRATSEARKRTKQIFQLPANEEVTIELVFDKSYGAANWYKGKFQSLMEFNASRPINLFSLLQLICHEGYPGHHTDSCLKEEIVLEKMGCFEQSMFVTLSPQLVIGEGIAEKAFEILFTPEQAAEWMIENIYVPLEIKYDDVDLPMLRQAVSRNSLDQISGNIVYLYHQGKPYEELVQYALYYTLEDEKIVRHLVDLVVSSRFFRLYFLSYLHGKRLVDRFLATGNEKELFYRLLTEQFTPSQLRGEATV